MTINRGLGRCILKGLNPVIQQQPLSIINNKRRLYGTYTFACSTFWMAAGNFDNKS